MGAIYKRELRSYVTGVTGPIFVAFLLLMIGIFTTAVNLLGRYPSFENALSSTVFIFMIITPLITMRSFADDKRTKTDQLLYSLPLSMTQIVLAKYFALVTILAAPCVLICLYPIILTFYGTVNLGAAYGAILAFFFLGCALLAIGMFLSTLTESQVIAAVLSLGTFILLNFMTGISGLLPVSASTSLIAFLLVAAGIGYLLYTMTKNVKLALIAFGVLALGIVAVYLVRSSIFEGSIQKVLSALAVFDRFNSFSNGVFDLSGLVYFITVAGLFVFFTIQSMEKKRWA